MGVSLVLYHQCHLEAYSDHAAAAAAESLKSVLIASKRQDGNEAHVSMMPKPVFLVTVFLEDAEVRQIRRAGFNFRLHY